ncbi:MAG: hypothetical protein JRH20_16670, partial [Deltaproteobacteria bacterium]|nr:hypothetical protein [Deltaproteobacteria bacterium]
MTHAAPQKRERRVSCWLVAVWLLLGSALPATAGGYDYPDHGVTALGRAGAFVARADDPLALIYNPAGAARLKGTQLL